MRNMDDQELYNLLKGILGKPKKTASEQKAEGDSGADIDQDVISKMNTADVSGVTKEKDILDKKEVLPDDSSQARVRVLPETYIRGKSTYSVAEIADILEIGRLAAYKLANNCESLKSFRVGGYIRISKPAFDEWLDGEGA